jgi:hypothetical protein
MTIPGMADALLPRLLPIASLGNPRVGFYICDHCALSRVPQRCYRHTPRMNWGLEHMAIGKGGQMSSIFFNGNLGLYQSWRRRRRGDPKTRSRHFRHTCTSVHHAYIEWFITVQVSVLLGPHRNRIFLGGRHRGERQFSPGLRRTSQQSVQGYCKKMYVHWNSFTGAQIALHSLFGQGSSSLSESDHGLKG